MESTMVFTGLSLLTLLLIPLILEFLRENMALVVSLCALLLVWQWISPDAFSFHNMMDSVSELPEAIAHKAVDNASGMDKLIR